MIDTLRALAVVGLLAAGAFAQGPGPLGPVAGRKLLVVDLDDVGSTFLAQVPTPFFDQLDQTARRYERFYTQPVCSPTRACMQMGTFASHPSVRCTALVRRLSPYRLPISGPLEPLASAVASVGRTTAKLGKWHLAPVTDPGHPRRAGWQSYYGLLSNARPPEDYFTFGLVIDDVLQPPTTGYLTTNEIDAAIAAVQLDVDLISLSCHAIHTPIHAPPTSFCSVPHPTSIQVQAGCMLQALDQELARLWAVAQTRGYHLILFADNGGLWDLGGKKGSLFELGVRCPMWVAGPGVVTGSDASIVAAEDVYATVLEFFDVPTSATRGPNSTSFLPTLLGTPGTRRHAFVERYEKNGADPKNSRSDWSRALVGKRYKLHVVDGVPALYDLNQDSDELVNLLMGTPSTGAQRTHRRFEKILAETYDAGS